MGRVAGSGGFTLIEIIITIVMAGILLPAIIVPFVTAVKGSGKPEKVTTAMYLAHQRMEGLMKYDYQILSTNSMTALTGWSGIDPGFFGYQQQWEIVYVPSTDLNAAGSHLPPDTRYIRIFVRVRDPENDTYEVRSVVTNFP